MRNSINLLQKIIYLFTEKSLVYSNGKIFLNKYLFFYKFIINIVNFLRSFILKIVRLSAKILRLTAKILKLIRKFLDLFQIFRN